MIRKTSYRPMVRGLLASAASGSAMAAAARLANAPAWLQVVVFIVASSALLAVEYWARRAVRVYDGPPLNIDISTMVSGAIHAGESSGLEDANANGS